MYSIKKAVLLTLVLLCCSCANRPSLPTGSPDLLRFINQTNNQQSLYALQTFLLRHDVQDVIPVEQLLQQGTDWKIRLQPQFAIPERRLWPQMVQTLKLVQRFVIPAIGPISVVSGFRTVTYNKLAGGANQSRHLQFSALDAMPQSTISRSALHKHLLTLWQIHGKHLNMGLGLYRGSRFHIDTGGYRKWDG